MIEEQQDMEVKRVQDRKHVTKATILTSTKAAMPSILQIFNIYLISRSGNTAAIIRTASAPLDRA
jgi:hypothetical protein